MVLWQRLATCSFAPGGAIRPSISNRSLGSCRSVGLARARCLLKLRQFWQKDHCSNLIFGAVNTLAFWTPTSPSIDVLLGNWPGFRKPGMTYISWCVFCLQVQQLSFFVRARCLSAGLRGLESYRGPAGNRSTTASVTLSATQECRDTNCTT